MTKEKGFNPLKFNRTLAELSGDSEMLNMMLEEFAVVAVTDRHGRILYASDKFCESSKYTQEELIGQNHRILNSGYHPKEFFTNLWETIKAGRVWRGDIRNRAKDGSIFWVHTTIVPFLDDKGRAIQFVSYRHDVTYEKIIEEKLSDSIERNRLITENMSDLIAIVDKESTVLYATPSSGDMIGIKPENLEKTEFLSWVHSDHRLTLLEVIEGIFTGTQESAEIEFKMKTNKDTYLDVEAKINPIQKESAEVIDELLFVIRDISFRKHSEKLIHQLTHYDILTGLANRGFFMKRLTKELYRQKAAEANMAIIYLDLDRFKNINDSEGHEAGDKVLTVIAERLEEHMNSKGFVARIGGDEFAVLITDADDKDEVLKTARSILEKVQEPIKLHRGYNSLTASAGISFYPNDGHSAEELIKRANIASDAVKMQRRNDVLVFKPGMEELSLERILLENEIRKAIEQGQFTIDYQPKFDLHSGQLTGVEALVRWNHPELGRISPGKFIPVAEEANLIHAIGKEVLRKGCLQNKEWQKKGFTPIRMSVNLSAKQFYQEDLVDQMKEILEETKLDPSWLEVEVTESIFTDIDHTMNILQQIRDLGIIISIDDFGTGYSSFSYLKHLPVDILKIDRSFIQDISLNAESRAIVQGIAEIADSIDLETIAEGIETEEQMEALKEIGIKQGQGFLFSKPVSGEEFTKFFEENFKWVCIK